MIYEIVNNVSFRQTSIVNGKWRGHYRDSYEQYSWQFRLWIIQALAFFGLSDHD